LAIHIGVIAVGIDLWFQWRTRVATDTYVAASAALDRQRTVDEEDSEPVIRQTAHVNGAYADVTSAEEAAQLGWAGLALLTAIAYLALARGDRASVGLLDAPTQGWKPWWGAAWRLGLVVVATVLPLGLFWRWMGWDWSGAWANISAGLEWEISIGLVGSP